jgi:NAD(P)-dependent dehydrogenase (short-subunit alcohol dehydrogenase family)
VSPRFAGKRCLVAGKGEVADAVRARLAGEGAEVAWISQDALTSERDVQAAVEKAAGALGGVDVLVTAFHHREDRPFLDLDEKAWQRSLHTNLKLPFLVGREVAKLMAAAGQGTIVHVTSDVAARPGPGTAAYAASKAGLNLLSLGMALDLAPQAVRVCTVAASEDGTAAPGGNPPRAEDTAAAVAFCASPDASYVLGSTFYLNGPLPSRG